MNDTTKLIEAIEQAQKAIDAALKHIKSIELRDGK